MKKATGIARIINATRYSLEGLVSTFRSEAAFRQELALVCIGVPIALLLHITNVERALLIGSLLLVLMVELFNTAIEAAINRISQDIHPLSKRAKDAGSAAVFLALVNAACMWGIILL